MTYLIRTVTAQSTIPPLFDLAEAKRHVRAEDHDDDDAVIAALIAPSQDFIERYTGQILTPRDMEMATDGFTSVMEIPRTPITAVTGIAYDDADGLATPLASDAWRWSVSASQWIMPSIASGPQWPSDVGTGPAAVRIAFTAGYAEGEAPPSLIAAVKLTLGHLFEHRESVGPDGLAELPAGVSALCAPYRRRNI